MNKKYERYINYIVSDIELPYIKYLNMYGLSDNEMVMILSKVFNESVSIEGAKVYNTDGNRIYCEDSDGFWYKKEWDANGNLIYCEDSDGYWEKYVYDINGNLIYSENSYGYWTKREYDSNGNLIYQEDSTGNIVNKRYERQI